MSMMPCRTRRRGFSLIELVIVIMLIGLLLQLLLPAVQAAREAARKTQCRNNLRQIALAFQLHHNTHQRFPSGGWHHRWVGEPERGTGVDQPGGWLFNLLPYLEAEQIRNIGRDLQGEERQTALAQRCAMPMPIMNCPSRRRSRAYPLTFFTKPFSRDGEFTLEVTAGAKSDYAASIGSSYPTASWHGLEWDDPKTLDAGDQLKLWPGDEGFVDAKGVSPVLNGIVYGHSNVGLRQMTDGASKTYLVGEKYLRPEHYKTGEDFSDNENMYQGFDDDTCRSAQGAPLPDSAAHGENKFGSAHSRTWNMAFADGSVKEISYTMYLQVHRSLASRAGGESLDVNSAQ